MKSMCNSTSKNFPKILVIDHSPFNRRHNNGIFKSNLFQGWPKDKLAQILYGGSFPGFDVCRNYWEIQWGDILRGIFRIPHSEERRLTERSENMMLSVADCFSGRGTHIPRLIPMIIRQIGGDFLFECSHVVSRHLGHWIAEFQPEIVFTLGGSFRILLLSLEIAQRYMLPILPFFTDDWIATLYTKYLFERHYRHKLIWIFKKLIDNAPIRLAISDAMSKEYKTRYGGNFEVFMNIVDDEWSQNKCNLRAHKDEIIHFLYIGSVRLNRWKMLREIGIALSNLRDIGVYGDLTVYTFGEDIREVGDQLSMEPVMRIAGTAPAKQVPKLQSKADVLVHVESFDREIRKYTKYSLSTKIPQYMMSGSCIFALGPPEVASIKYLKDCNAAMVICDVNSNAIFDALRTLIENSKLRHSLGMSARKIAMKRHEGSSQRERFRQTICESIRLWNMKLG